MLHPERPTRLDVPAAPQRRRRSIHPTRQTTQPQAADPVPRTHCRPARRRLPRRPAHSATPALARLAVRRASYLRLAAFPCGEAWYLRLYSFLLALPYGEARYLRWYSFW